MPPQASVPAGIGPCRCVSAAEEELHSLDRALHFSSVWGRSHPSRRRLGRGPIFGRADGRVGSSKQAYFFLGGSRGCSCSREFMACATPWEQVLKPGKRGGLLFGNALGYGSSLVLFCEPSRKGKGRSL